MANPDRVQIRNISRRRLRFGANTTSGGPVFIPPASPTGTGATAFVDASDPQVKRDFYRNLGSYIMEAGPSNGTSTRIAKVPLTATTATTAGAVGNWQNPEGQVIFVTKVVLDVTTASSGAANVTSIWSATATGSTLGTVGAAQAVGTAGAFSPANTNVGRLASTDYVIFTGSADTTGMVANAYIHYHVLY